MSDAEHWEQLQHLFFLAETVPAGERERVLTEACGDITLRRRALEILQGAEAEAPERPAPVPHESAMGPYRLLRLIGSGGTGTVYLAERMVGSVVQRSALKVLAPHAAGPSFVERFQREQHILASLDHPNITRMLDAGLRETGQPYLVMEYVDGVHLDAYCDLHRFPIDQRVRLFLKVCDAVAYAHRNLVVHLDLKPSNTLVTTDGMVKLLDFGTSKLIEQDGRLTSTLMATPAYASPEQMRGEPVTTLCDVYSLGAMLFEVLAGHRPAPGASVIDIMDRAAREKEAEPLGSALTEEAAAARGLTLPRLRSVLAGDLATIVAKCLRPRPRDRYPSVLALANDMQRYLDGQPVLAQPQTTAYRIGKFLRRNRLPVALAAAAGVVLSAALGFAAWRQHQALAEGQRALRMQTFLYRTIKLANSNHTGKPDATLPEFLELSVEVLPRYITDPRDLREAQLALAEAMYDNGDLSHSGPVFQLVMNDARRAGDAAAEAEAESFAGAVAFQEGRTQEGLRFTEQALALSARRGMPASIRVWSEIHYAVNRVNYGFRSDRNLAVLEDAVKQTRAGGVTAEEAGTALTSLGEVLMVKGDPERAEPYFLEALAIYQKDPLALCERSGVYGDLGWVKSDSGDNEASLRNYQKAYEGYAQCEGANSRNALAQLEQESGRLVALHRAREAVALMEPTMPAWRELLKTNPDLAEPLYYMGLAYVESGEWARAASLAVEAIDVQTGHVPAGDRRFGMAEWIWARALAGQQRYPEALEHARLADTMLARFAVSPRAKRLSADAHTLRQQLEAQSNR